MPRQGERRPIVGVRLSSAGIARVDEADGLSGTDAIRLWREYRRGGRRSEEALRLLLSYNREDVVNMKFLLDYALPRMREDSGFNAVPALAGGGG